MATIELSEYVLEAIADRVVKKWQEAQPVIEEDGITACCPNCRSAAWMTNADEELNNYCGLCGQRLDWANPEDPDAEEAEEAESEASE